MTLAHAVAQSGTRRHFLRTVLALSLALNLFFVVGALWIRVHAPAPPITPEQRLEQMGTELGLDAQQRRAFADYSQAMRQRLQSMHQAIGPLISQAWSEVAKPQANETRIMQLLDQAGQKHRAFAGQLTTTTLSFLATLSPEQRSKFVELARHGPRPWSAPHPHGEAR
ncbi:MAG TPA: periplasmic heavy metal sensor [Stellaceae bacterium]